MGGFFDGIVFHQLLQWHHMLSAEIAPNTLEGLQLNTLADGLFHSATYGITAVGLWLLFRAVRQNDVSHATHVLSGAMCIGFGAFNLIEGTINHHILGIHHVRPGDNQIVYDLAFLAIGGLLVLIGIALMQYRYNSAPD